MQALSEICSTILGKCGKRPASSYSALPPPQPHPPTLPEPGGEHLCYTPSFSTILAPILVGCELVV